MELRRIVRLAALLVAGGRGTRFGAELPKQFELLGGEPLFLHAARTLHECAVVDALVVVAPQAAVESVRQQLGAADLDRKVLAVVAGGATRQESVWNGLEALGAFTHVLVHDAVRPFVSEAMVLETLGAATLHGAASSGLAITDSLFRVEHQADERQEGPFGSLETARAAAPLGRDGVWSVQTPQVFELELLREAHRHARARGLDATDDGRLVLELGKRLELVPGRWWNIKVTHRVDLQRAEMLLALRQRLLAAEELS